MRRPSGLSEAARFSLPPPRRFEISAGEAVAGGVAYWSRSASCQPADSVSRDWPVTSTRRRLTSRRARSARAGRSAPKRSTR